ncbi:hypothetical protein [Catellatospora sp. NPDC049609]|uniref:hypothetical protein n=1 Tax=Catellatospora sp. NPDC049609 TaxID=3155505 RepID=UPI003426BA3A
MAVQPKDSALNEALRLDFTAARTPRTGDDLGATVLECLAAAPEPLTACVVVYDLAGLPTGTYCLDPAGLLHRIHPRPPTPAHPAADVAVLIGGRAPATPADFRRLALAAGVAAHHLSARLGTGFHVVTCDDDTTAWPLAAANGATTHLTTVTGKEPR